MGLRTEQALASIYGNGTPPAAPQKQRKSGPCPECHVDVQAGGEDVHAEGCSLAARRAELRDLTSGRGRKGSAARKQLEEEMATKTRETAEAMNLKDLRKVLSNDFKVAGASKLSKPDAVEAFVKASKPASKSRTNGDAEGQTRVPSPIKWESADGEFAGSSKSANWNGSRYVIKNYLDGTGAKPDEIKAGLKEAKEKLDAGAKSVKVLDVTIKVYDPNA